MSKKEFDVDYWEDVWAATQIPHQVRSKDIHELHCLFDRILPANNLSLIEIGCAPGGWLAYFYNHFHYSVSGIEYAPLAFKKTVENLTLLNVPAELYFEDFFQFRHEPYDCVFSAGFIEHFANVRRTVNHIINLCKPEGLVITIIPSMGGVNGWISKTFRPSVAAGHFTITKTNLVRYHEAYGLHTLYCSYLGSLYILPPMEKNLFSREHWLLSSIINLPFRAWNRFLREVTKSTGVYPKLRLVSTSVVYIGRRKRSVKNEVSNQTLVNNISY